MINVYKVFVIFGERLELPAEHCKTTSKLYRVYSLTEANKIVSLSLSQQINLMFLILATLNTISSYTKKLYHGICNLDLEKLVQKAINN